MSKSEPDIRSKVDRIIAERRRMLPQVERELSVVLNRSEGVRVLVTLLSDLRRLEKDPDVTGRIEEATSELARLLASLGEQAEALEMLKRRFSRDTVNIGVSGEARVGKSTTLQRFAGLGDTQIPTGDGLPVTAVRSEIVNSTDEYAEVTFRDQGGFLSEYVAPLLDVVNARLKDPLRADTFSAFRSLELPEDLGDNVDSVAADGLKRLREAQRSIDSFADLLRGGTQRIALADLRRYVAYPTNQELQQEDAAGRPADRAYVAVKAVKIFCPFPNLDGVRVALIDLPGLGEIGSAVADMHLGGLEDGVDQIFPIMRPTESEGFVKQGIASNLDHLRRVQPGVRRRSDLITAGINVYAGLDQTVETLAADFERSINGAQRSDKIELLTYSAVDSSSVSQLFERLLEKVGDRLPAMDQEVFEHTARVGDDRDAFSQTLDGLTRTLNELLRRIPLPERLLSQQIDRICSAIVHAYNTYEVELTTAVGERGNWYEEFDKSVATIHERTSSSLADGLFLGAGAWRMSALGQKDYYNYFRDEAKRLRREIIAAYSGLDSFYDDHVTEFKSKAVEIFLQNTGNLRSTFGLQELEDPDAQIDKIASELGGTVKDEDLDSALSLLRSVQFSFRNNVFLQISKHPENLANPPETHGGYRGENIRVELGGLGDIDAKMEKLACYLRSIADEANDNIRDALLKHDDRFHEYLAVSASFFIDHLYRKDFENFKHVVVRGLVNEYRDLVLDDRAVVAVDHKKKDLIDRAKGAVKALQDGSAMAAPKSGGSRRRTGGALQKGRRYQGTVKKVVEFGAFVDVGLHRQGLIHVGSLNGKHVAEGDTLEVEVASVSEDGKFNLVPVRS